MSQHGTHNVGTPEGQAPSPQPDDDWTDGEFAPIVELLREGAADNGVDLAPWWRGYLANQQGRRRSSSAGWGASLARYAAVLVGGIAIGAIAGAAVGERGSRPSVAIGSQSRPESHYTTRQRQLMVALLDAAGAEKSAPGGAVQTVRLGAGELGGCVACHERVRPALRTISTEPPPRSNRPAGPEPATNRG